LFKVSKFKLIKQSTADNRNENTASEEKYRYQRIKKQKIGNKQANTQPVKSNIKKKHNFKNII